MNQGLILASFSLRLDLLNVKQAISERRRVPLNLNFRFLYFESFCYSAGKRKVKNFKASMAEVRIIRL